MILQDYIVKMDDIPNKEVIIAPEQEDIICCHGLILACRSGGVLGTDIDLVTVNLSQRFA